MSERVKTPKAAPTSDRRERRQLPAGRHDSQAARPALSTRHDQVLALHRTVGNRAVGRMLAVSPAPHRSVQRLKDEKGTEITETMVASANLEQLEQWSKLEADDWEDEIPGLIEDRIRQLKEEQGTTTTPGSPSVLPSETNSPVDTTPPTTPEEQFEARVGGHALKRSLMNIFGTDPQLAEDVRSGYNPSNNPALSEELLVRLTTAGLLWMDRALYRRSAGGQNGMIYYFYVSQTKGACVGEWHVHWNSGRQPGAPGWKRGYKGTKEGGAHQPTMKALLGTWWAVVKGSPGSRVKAGT